MATKCATHGGTRLSRWRGSGVRISLLVVRSAGVWVGLALRRRGRSKRDERTLLLRKFSTISTRRPPAKRGRAVVSNRAEEPSILVSSAATRRSSLPVRASRGPRGDRCSSRRRSGYRNLGSSGPKPLGVVASDHYRGLCRPRAHRPLLIDRVTTSLSDSMPRRPDKRRQFLCSTLCKS